MAFQSAISAKLWRVSRIDGEISEKAIKAILGQADINDEEFMTTIIGAEGLINSRPLTYQSACHIDDVPLTPNHFLHGQIGGNFAPTSVEETQFSPPKRWRHVQ